MKVTCKIWIDQNGKAFGEGPYRLLRGVEKTDSLHQAADQMGMAYSKAWRLIRTMEQRLGFPLLDRKVGGQSGGGSRITVQAKELMLRYDRFRAETQAAMEKAFLKHFGPLNGRRVKRGTASRKK